MADSATDAGVGRADKLWGVTKAVLYELKPFSLPSKDDILNFAKATHTNLEQLRTAVTKAAPEALDSAKGIDPRQALGLFAWLCGWVVFIWLEFGAVYFIISAMATIFVNLGEREEGEWSAYSVFNAGCRALLGTMNVEQFEREIMRQNVAAPDHHDNDEDDDFVFIEPDPDQAAGVDNAAADTDADGGNSDDDNGSGDEDDGDGMGAGGAGAVRGAGGGRKVSGKRARRGFKERRERQEERRLALQALGQGEWD